MLMVVSPAKALDESTVDKTVPATDGDFLSQAESLIEVLKPLGPVDVGLLMGLSEKLSELNFQRFQDWQLPMSENAARQAAFMFKGDVYQGLNIRSLDQDSVTYLQNHLRILSGLYGALRPLDKILPYRLEMGTPLQNPKGKNLYEFWGHSITDWLNAQFDESGSKVLVNLASNEYFKVIQKKSLQADVITPQFKDWKSGQYKMISFYAKKARGLMARYAAINKIEQVDDLKFFDYEGYQFAPELSSEKDWVFTRKQ